MPPIRAATGLLALVVLLGLAAAPSARAAVSCNFAGGTMTVSATAGSFAEVVVNGGAIEAHGGSGAVPCGSPTTTNTDKINLDDDSSSTLSTSAAIDLGGGPFAPGDTGEDGDSDEIEFDVQDFEILTVEGTGAVDRWRAGSVGLNLNLTSEGGFMVPTDADVTLEGLEVLAFNAENGNDTIGAQGGFATGSPMSIRVVLRGSGGMDDAIGGSGNDTVGDLVESGPDDLSGGSGDDRLIANDGDDSVDGGPGTDTATYVNGVATGVNVSLAETAEQDTGGGGEDSLTSIENLEGSFFSDTLTGDASPNRITGGDEGDVIDGGGGGDTLLGDGASGSGAAGADMLLIRDGSYDIAGCGPLADTVVADHPGLDAIAADCESVLRDSVLLQASARRRQRLGRRIRLRAGCPLESCRVLVRASVRVPRRPAGAAALVALKPVSRSIPAGETPVLRLKLGRRVRRLLAGRRRSRAVLSVIAADPLGSTDTAQLKVRLRR